MNLADWFRVVNAVLAILYMPLIYFRIRDNEDAVYRQYLLGIFIVLVSIIGGSYLRLGDAKIGFTPGFTLGLVVLIIASTVNQVRFWRNQRAAHRGRRHDEL